MSLPSSLQASVVYEDGRYPFAATAAREPGEVVIRPSGTLAIYDGLDGCAIGDRISPCPVRPYPIVEYQAASADTWAVATALYWDDTANKITATASTHKRVGVAIAAKTAGQTTALVEGTPA